MVKIFHNPRCRKSRETLEILKGTGEEITIIEYLQTPPTQKELKEVLQMLQITPESLVRKGEPEYKADFKGKKLSDDEWIRVLADHPKLIERPIVIKGSKAIIGRPPENVLKIL